MTLRVGSLCSGYGGLELAVASVLDAEPAWFCEYDRDPSLILAHHWPETPNHGDVWATDWAAIEPIDILTAGYPCQPFSHAGKRKGADDPRHLWPGVARAIGVLRPRLVVLENVRGHVSLGLADVLGDLSALGYDARWGVVRAADAGAPHGRARIFITAHPRNADGLEQGPLPGALAGPGAVAGRTGAVASDADRGQLPRPGTTGHGLRVAPERGPRPPADADGDGHGQGPDAGSLGRLAQRDAGAPRERQRAREIARDRGAAAAPDTDSDGRARLEGLPPGRDAVHGDSGSDPDRCGPVVEWGAYGPAIDRWQRVLGRPAPRPTEPGRTGERLSPRFVEWMMGLPEGHVTAVPDLSRNAQLKALGNGVVPQQAAHALRLLLASEVAAA